jgi:hypothetical protein
LTNGPDVLSLPVCFKFHGLSALSANLLLKYKLIIYSDSQMFNLFCRLDDISLILIQQLLFVDSSKIHASQAFILPFLSPFDRVL